MTTAEYAPELATVPEAGNAFSESLQAVQGFAGRLANRVQSGLETLGNMPRGLKAGLALSAIALSGLGHAEQASADVDPFAAPPVPALTGAATLSTSEEGSNTTPAAETPLSTLEIQQCKEDILARPDVLVKPRMTRAGIRTEQGTTAGFEYPAVADYCAPEYIRSSQIDLLIKKNGHWFNLGGEAAASWGSDKQHTTLEYYPSHARPAYVYDECVDGHFQTAKVEVINSVKAGENGHRKVDEKHTYTLKVDVNGNCQAAIRSRKYYETHRFPPTIG